MSEVGKFNLICYGYNPWSNMWKRNQTMLSMLARRPYIGEVLFLNPYVYLASLLERPFRELTKFRRNYWRYVFPRNVQRNITVFSHAVLPWASRNPILREMNHLILRNVLRPYVSAGYILLLNRFVRFEDTIFSHLFENAFLRVFDWSDDFETFCSSNEERAACAAIRERYVRECHLVITVNDRLAERARTLNPNSFTIRNATDFEHMNRADRHETEVAYALRRLPKPIVGYVGYLNSDRLDVGLIDHLSLQRPEWQFVFMGPHTHDNPLGKELPKRKNVHILPSADYCELPGYLKGFDVCIIPNRLNEHTRGNDPIKLYDYLASGRPVVSTPTSGTEEFSDVISISRSNEEFLRSIGEALKNGNSKDLKMKRLKRAKENSWTVRFGLLSTILEEKLLQAGTASPRHLAEQESALSRGIR